MQICCCAEKCGSIAQEDSKHFFHFAPQGFCTILRRSQKFEIQIAVVRGRSRHRIAADSSPPDRR